MTLEQLRIIMKAADVLRVDRNILGAAVMYNIEYVSVRPQHVQNFRTTLYYVCRNPINWGLKHTDKIEINSPDEAWQLFNQDKPSTERDLLAVGQSIKAVDCDAEIATDTKAAVDKIAKDWELGEKIHTVILDSIPDKEGVFSKLLNKVKGLF